MVITFLPYPDVKKSIACLDDRRCGKQRLEAKQLLNVLLNRSTKGGWRNHPATLMWVGYEVALQYYYNCCLDEWISRGKNNTMEYETITDENSGSSVIIGDDYEGIVYPWWWGWTHFHESHKASLKRKFPDYYNFEVDTFYMERGYIWPSKLDADWMEFSHHIVVENGKLCSDTIEDPDTILEIEYLFEVVNNDGIRPQEETRKLLYTVSQLRVMAKEAGYTGYSKLKKDELLELLGLL